MLLLSTDKKKDMWNSTQATHFIKYLSNTFLAGSPVEINNCVPTSQARYPQFRVTERFCVESSNKRSDRGAPLYGFTHYVYLPYF